MATLNFSYDEERDVLTIEGIEYSGRTYRERAYGVPWADGKGLSVGDALRLAKAIKETLVYEEGRMAILERMLAALVKKS